jgi:hypothetical protein
MEKQIIKKSKINESIIASAIILFGFLLIFILLRKLLDWPGADTEKTVLTGIFIFTLLPFALIIVEIIIRRGGKFELGILKIDISDAGIQSARGIIIPANIGVRGPSISETDIISILNALREATSKSIVVVDIESGEAWWETRLLLLLSGAQRLGIPDKIVFVGTQAGKLQYFFGWASPADLLENLLNENLKYRQVYFTVKAISLQLKLLEPVYNAPNQPVQVPVTFPWMKSETTISVGRVFDFNTGLTKELFEEELLQNELKEKIENPDGGKYITAGRITDLFGKVLNMNFIDENETPDQQLRKLYSEDVPFIALTIDGRYSSLVSRFAIYNEILKKLTEKIAE